MERIRKNKLAIIVFMLPAVVLFVGIIILPIIQSLRYSFNQWDGFTDMKYIGFDNYKELITEKDSIFNKTIINALLLAFFSVFIQLPFSLFLAIKISRGIKGERFFMTLFFVPVLISTVVIAELWKKIYYYDGTELQGILNMLLDSFGFHTLAQTSWLGDRKTALYAALVPILWQFVGYHMLLMYAGIKSVSPDVIEAAKIDGASEFQISTRIVIPLLKPVIKICVIFAVTGSLKAFDMIWILTGGGPVHSSDVPSTLMVTEIFHSQKYGLGSAIAVMIIILCFVFALLIKKCIRTEDYDEK